MKCDLCPRKCLVDRKKGEKGICGQTENLKVARAALHFWEEPCISGDAGSGAVFFSGCPLHCVFCQNENIANGMVGKEISLERLVDIFLELQKKRANNINLVTPGHFVPQIVKALDQARKEGLTLPVVYNTSSYETVDTIKMLEGYVDIYLPDFKYMSPGLSKKYSHAPDYAEVAKAAIAEMVRQTGKAVFVNGDEDNLILRGTIVRHLTLPGCMADSMQIVKYLHDTYGDKIYISIMNQFTPLSNLEKYPELNRRITDEEYETLVDYA
ncbi:radical SAM protein, partial [Roseburia inulinivorans]|uniref:radical SAM protein n=1 Tax=Roseburia inulinivorans TaxID=360807 RepID=UPI002672CD4B